MNDYIAARSDVFFTGRDGSLRSNRLFGQLAGHYACDAFNGATLQMMCKPTVLLLLKIALPVLAALLIWVVIVWGVAILLMHG